MANRFNQFQNTEYIGLPVDYYQMGLMAQEQESQQQLNQTKLALDTAYNITAVFNPDKELKRSLLGNVESKIKELTTKRLNSKGVLMQLGRIVNDSDLIDKLAGIQMNSTNYQKALEKAAEYKKKFGNDINLQQFNDMVESYNKQTKDGFKSNFLAGYEPDAYVDVIGDLQKVLKDSGINSENITYEQGNYFVTVNNKKRLLNDLLKDAGVMLNDPKYQTQIQNYIYYQASRLGNGDVNRGFEVGKQQYIESLQNQLAQYQERAAVLRSSKDKKEQEMVAEYDKAIDKTTKEINTALKTDAGTVFSSGVKDNFALMAAAPYDFQETGRKIEYTPAYLKRLQYNLQDRNNARQAERNFNNQYRLWQLKKEESERENTVMPTSISFKFKDDNGKEIDTPVTFFDASAGWNMNNLSQLFSAALSSQSQFYDISGKKYTKDTWYSKSDGTTKNSILQRVKNGTAQLGFAPGTKDLIIATETNTYRIKAPIDWQQNMSNLHDVMKSGLEYTTPKIIQIPSDDLKQRIPAVLFSEYDKKMQLIPKLFQFTDNGYNLNKVSDKEINKKLGISETFNANYKGLPDGVYVVGDYNFSVSGEGYTGFENKRDIKPYSEYNNLLENGKITPTVGKIVYKRGSELIPVREYDIGEAGINIISRELQMNSKTGGFLQYSKSPAASKTTKTKSSTSQGMQFTIPDDDDDDDDFNSINF